MKCTKSHRYELRFAALPLYQGGKGRHKCAACAYEEGYRQGLNRTISFTVDLDSLPESQAGSVRHKCPHAAFAIGYQHGISDSHEKPAA
ncbi:hypothetical protein ACEV94_22875 [Vibrio parahaemolyticus]|nr:hypothetical protein [Vibrio parahaemolyticus]HCE1808706.1 hypothetical protein [Vibrio parahaemolyticus]HCG7676323.1 hypothetical protein [Vibrio parahaemolyticus]